MNIYGRRAQEYWREFRPRAYRTIPDPTAFFSVLGEQIADQVAMVTDRLAGPPQAGQGYLAVVGRLNNARCRAEAIAINDLISTYPPEILDHYHQPPAKGSDRDRMGDYLAWARQTDRQDQQLREQLHREREDELDRQAATPPAR